MNKKTRLAYFTYFVELQFSDDLVVVEFGNLKIKKNMYGKIVQGVLRSTFIIDEAGKIVHIFRKVKTDTHSQDVLTVVDAR